MQRDTIQKTIYTENIGNRAPTYKGYITKRRSNPTYENQANKQTTGKVFWQKQNTSLNFYEHQVPERSWLARIHWMRNVGRDHKCKNPQKQKSYCAFKHQCKDKADATIRDAFRNATPHSLKQLVVRNGIFRAQNRKDLMNTPMHEQVMHIYKHMHFRRRESTCLREIISRETNNV